MSARGAGPSNPESEKALEAVRTPADFAKLPFGLRAQLASAAAWSPNPVVAESEEPAALSRFADQGWRDPAGSAGKVGGERTPGVRRSVHRQPDAVRLRRQGPANVNDGCESRHQVEAG